MTGRAQVDDINITVARGPRVRPATPPTAPVFTGHDEPRLRGAMISPDITPESLRVLGQEWNANLIRWQLIRYGPAAKIATAAEYDAWLEGALRRVLQPVRDWQQDHGVQIYLGEFSAIRWAPDDSADRYLQDCIELFEEFGWDWSYHAFRE